MCRSVSNFATTIINTIITVMVKNTRVYIYRYKKLVYITLFDMYAFICDLSHRAVDKTSSLRYRRIRGREIQTMDDGSNSGGDDDYYHYYILPSLDAAAREIDAIFASRPRGHRRNHRREIFTS